jgi:hypothetical protein
MPRFYKAMETKYSREWGSNKCGSIAKAAKITDKKTKYLRLGYTQNPRKVEMAKCGAATTKKSGPACDIGLHLADTGEKKDLCVTAKYPQAGLPVVMEKFRALSKRIRMAAKQRSRPGKQTERHPSEN